MRNRTMVLRIKFVGCILMVTGWLSAPAVQAQVTRETYKKAEYFLSGNLQKEIYHLEVIPNWLENRDAFWHVTNARNGKRFFFTSIAGKTTLEAFDHELLADLLEEKTGEQNDSRNLPFERIEIRKDSVVAFEWKNRNWTFDSYNGKREFEYGTYYGWGDIIKGENGIRPHRFFLTWSPDSRAILSQIVDFRRAEKMYLLYFSKDEKFRPELLLAHGAIDENVNPSATYTLAEALIKAGKDFDLFIWPGKSHSFGRPAGDYFTKKRWDYFIQ